MPTKQCPECRKPIYYDKEEAIRKLGKIECPNCLKKVVMNEKEDRTPKYCVKCVFCNNEYKDSGIVYRCTNEKAAIFCDIVTGLEPLCSDMRRAQETAGCGIRAIWFIRKEK
jgi:DNA-directed RNA polymerase subunit RPC12/RpoP